MTDSHDQQQKLQAAPEGVDAICDAFEAAGPAGPDPHLDDVLSFGNSVHRDLDQQ